MSDLPVLTSVEPDPRGEGAVRLTVNGRMFGVVPRATAIELGLRPGMVVDDLLRQRLSRAADAQAAWRFIIAALGRRGFARKDLERRLVHKGHPREAAQAAVERAVAAGLLDDTEFARDYARAKAARGRGPARLLRDLGSMGVERGVADAAVAEAWRESDSILAVSRTLAQKRSAQLGSLPPAVKRRRVLAFLARRGFIGREVRAMVRTLAS